MLLDWIAGYLERDDSLSYLAHYTLFQIFQGKKTEISGMKKRHIFTNCAKNDTKNVDFRGRYAAQELTELCVG